MKKSSQFSTKFIFLLTDVATSIPDIDVDILLTIIKEVAKIPVMFRINHGIRQILKKNIISKNIKKYEEVCT